MGRADASGDGRIDFDEWCSIVGEVLDDGDRYAAFVNPIVDSVFSMLDQDGDGMISEEEYSAVWQAGAHDDDDGAAVYRRLLGDGARSMSIDDMRNLLERFFRSQDPDEPANLFFGPLTR